MDEVDRQCWRGPGLCSLEAAGYDITLTYTQYKEKNLWAQLQVAGFALYSIKSLLRRTWFSSVISDLPLFNIIIVGAHAHRQMVKFLWMCWMKQQEDHDDV